jgi:endonuclease/exonuclease/phosphatase family metal-dependent hydrolase
VALLVRTWNLFHGNASPPGRRSHLRAMVELATEDGPDVLCLQEIPVWAVGSLGAWSGMQAFTAIARHGVPAVRLAGWATRLHNGLLRSALTGQANAILVRAGHRAEDLGYEEIGGAGLERRVCQAVRVDASYVVVNTHLSSRGDGQQQELDRMRVFAETLAQPGEAVVLAGDFNLGRFELPGYTRPGEGIDHVLVRGASATEECVWPLDRRRQNGRVLSDHAPVEVSVG